MEGKERPQGHGHKGGGGGKKPSSGGSSASSYKISYKYRNRRGSRAKTTRLDEITCTMSLRSEDFRQPWFHRHATRGIANKLLSDQKIGTFLIRPSSERGCYAMTWVQGPNDIRHNLIYGLMPGFSLSERPSDEKEKFWTLSSLVENCDFLIYPLVSSEFTDKRGNLTPDGRYIRRSITRTSSEVVEKIVDKLEKNVNLFTTLGWSLSVTECALGGDASSWGNQDENDDQQLLAAMAFTSNVEKRTFVRYCGKEYVAPELMPLQDSAAEVIIEALRVNTTLQSLSILGHDGESSMRMNFAANFTDKEAVSLADSLRVNKTLTTIDLSVNAIRDKGAIALAQALMAEGHSVKNLNLSSNFIGRDGLTALANLLRSNSQIETMRVDKQLRWEGATRAIVMQSGAYERAVVSLIHAAVQRRAELQQTGTSPFHGYLSHSDVKTVLNGHAPGSYLFYVSGNMANTLWVGYVGNEEATTKGEGKYAIRSRMLHRVEYGYSFTRSAASSQSEYGGVSSLRDYCLWRICGDRTLYKQCNMRASEDIKERMKDIETLKPLWCLGALPVKLGINGSVMGQDVFPHMLAVVQRNSSWLCRPVARTSNDKSNNCLG